jgi:hypothetical protein
MIIWNSLASASLYCKVLVQGLTSQRSGPDTWTTGHASRVAEGAEGIRMNATDSAA